MTKVSDGAVRPVFAFFTEIGILDQLASAELARALGSQMNKSEFGVLTHFVRRDDPVTPTHLAKAFQMAKPSMTVTLSKLEAKGLVSIEASPQDRRQKFVRITRKGRIAHQEALSRIAPLMAERLAGFDTAKIAAILPVLGELRAHMDAARNRADRIG